MKLTEEKKSSFFCPKEDVFDAFMIIKMKSIICSTFFFAKMLKIFFPFQLYIFFPIWHFLIINFFPSFAAHDCIILAGDRQTGDRQKDWRQTETVRQTGDRQRQTDSQETNRQTGDIQTAGDRHETNRDKQTDMRQTGNKQTTGDRQADMR